MKTTMKLACLAVAAVALALSSGCASTGSTEFTGSNELIPGTTVTRGQYLQASKGLHGGATSTSQSDMDKHLARGANAYYGAIP